jgi:hypothetical protein
VAGRSKLNPLFTTCWASDLVLANKATRQKPLKMDFIVDSSVASTYVLVQLQTRFHDYGEVAEEAWIVSCGVSIRTRLVQHGLSKNAKRALSFESARLHKVEAIVVFQNSSRGGTRTPDPVINSHLLYHLSYSGIAMQTSDSQRPNQPIPLRVFPGVIQL